MNIKITDTNETEEENQASKINREDKVNMKKWILDVSNSVDRYALPLITFPGMELTKKKLRDLVVNGQDQYESLKALSDRYPSLGLVTAMDLSVEAEAFGSHIIFEEDEVPTVIGRLVSNADDLEKLKVPQVGEGRTGVYIKAAELAAKNIKDKLIFAGQIGPFSLAGRLFDLTEIMMGLFTDGETVHALLEKVTRFLVEYAKAFKAVGANGIIIAEPAAGLLSPEQCEEFSSQYVKKIVDAVQDDYFMVILHNCGNTMKLIPSMLATGALGLHFGNSVNLEDVLPQIPWGRMAFGNIDPAGYFKNATREEMKKKTWDLLKKTAIYKNFIISSGCDVPPGTPIENIDEFFDSLSEFNRTFIRITG